MAAEGLTCVRCSATLKGRATKYCSGACQKDAVKDAYMQETYGITLEQWKGLYDFQGGVCAICQRAPQGRRMLVVDHEHNRGPSGKVRGLICSIPCNLKIVSKHKDGEILRRAADYLDNPPAVQYLGEVIAPGRKPKPRKPRTTRRKRA